MVAPKNNTLGLILFLILTKSVFAQQPVNVADTLLLSGDTLRLSHSFIVPFSEKIHSPSGEVFDASNYNVDYGGGIIILPDSLRQKGKWIVSYRYFPKGLANPLSLRKLRILTDSISQQQTADVIFENPGESSPDVFWESPEGIRKSGSLSRGITAGNNRGLSVTSGLRLQIEGDLGDGLKIVGAITDENLPIQPDGTTQQISDFDRVFVQLSKGPVAVTVGDFEVSRRHTNFANIYRNVQGLQVSYNGEDSRISASGAVAKGKFHTNSFMGVDGVSGPYRLTGKNRERLFIVLAGSEKVYINGKLMQRGENLDYIIDYNTAEVTFTSRHVITNVTRIVVDFEYNDRYFNRSLVVADMEQDFFKDRLKIGFAYSRDSDNPNAPFDNPEAFEDARDTLSQVGDNGGLATTSGIFNLGYDDQALRYERKDTVIAGTNYERYVFSNNPVTAIYGMFFSYVGPGGGYYQQDRSGINNNVFTWLPPDLAGIPQGDYAPVRTWVLPRLLEVADARVSFRLTEKITLYSESAMSNEDLNRLSSLNDEDNKDFANRAGIVLKDLKIRDSLTLSADIFHQYVGKRYTNLDRLYQAEYGRIWNFDESGERQTENIGMSKISLNYKNRLEFQVETGLRNTGPDANTLRQMYSVNSNLPRFLNGNYMLTHINRTDAPLNLNSRWQRHEGDIFAPLGKIQPGVVIWIENREDKFRDSIQSGSFSFRDLRPYIRTSGIKKLQAELSWNYRFDREWLNGKLRDKSVAQTWMMRTTWTPSASFRFQQATSYRNLEVRDSSFYATGLQNSRLLNTNLQTTVLTKNQLFYANFVYDVNSEQIARQEVRFIEVNPGLGQFVWLDSLFNNDGIQDIEEFQVANNPLIANFIRVVVPTRELFPTTRLSLSGNIRWNFRQLFPVSDNTRKEILRNIQAQTTFRVNQNKSRNSQIGSYFIDFTDPFSDTTLLNANYNIRQDLSFFQNNPVGDLRFAYQDSKSKLFLSTGDELRGLKFGLGIQRLNIGSSKSIEWESRIGNQSALAEAFETRNFNINFWETNPRMNFQFNRKFRFTTGYVYKQRKNTNQTGVIDARLNVHKLVFDARWNLKERNNLFTKLELSNLSQKGEPGFSAEYELREGLQPGFNAVWQVFITVYILSNVELSLTYDGRAAIETPIIHTGRIQVRAFF
ncbi:MAG: hypothetical protein SF052_12960 [Bacteroidia bacterium]|nr:hypothetical protein [Bacteroidia bacterium]